MIGSADVDGVAAVSLEAMARFGVREDSSVARRLLDDWMPDVDGAATRAVSCEVYVGVTLLPRLSNSLSGKNV